VRRGRPSPRELWDLAAYRYAHDACFQLLSKLIPQLPAESAPGTAMLRRCSQRIPDLLTQGLATWHAPEISAKYLRMVTEECEQIILSLIDCRDGFPQHVNRPLCDRLIELYHRIADDLSTLLTAKDRDAAFSLLTTQDTGLGRSYQSLSPPPAPVPQAPPLRTRKPRTMRFGMDYGMSMHKEEHG